MKLTDEQRKIYEGLICPYCGRETELVEANAVYGSGYKGMIRLCRPCEAWVGCHKEKVGGEYRALGSLARSDLRWDRRSVHTELDRLWITREERVKVYKELSDYLGIPKEYTHIAMFREKTLPRVLDFCITKKEEFGLKLQRVDNPDYPPTRNKWLYCHGNCTGCPSRLFRTKELPIYCDEDVVYHNLKWELRGELERRKEEARGKGSK